MHASWSALCGALHIPSSACLNAWSELVALYATPLRAYHSLAHVEQTLRSLDEIAPSNASRPACELALWFHDCVYLVSRSDNEEQSADAMRRVTREWPIDDALRNVAASAILATKHAWPPENDVAQAVVDADLSILASDAACYDAYVRAIRAEYAFVSDADFAAGRSKFLREMLAKSALFHTAFATERWERAARSNIARELDNWKHSK
jgi:predicted metal-dependent HD superfamily phosphohydrolase